MAMYNTFRIKDGPAWRGLERSISARGDYMTRLKRAVIFNLYPREDHPWGPWDGRHLAMITVIERIGDQQFKLTGIVRSDDGEADWKFTAKYNMHSRTGVLDREVKVLESN